MNISSVYVQKVNAGLLDSLQSGSLVLFSVKGKGHNGVYTILIGGRPLSVRSGQVLVPGMEYRARLIKFRGRIELKILKDQVSAAVNDILTEVSLNIKIPLDDTLKSIVAALMKSGISLTGDILKEMQRGSKIAGRNDPGFLRLLSLLVDKKIPLTPDIVNFFGTFAGDSPDGKSRDKQDQQNQDSKDNLPEDENAPLGNTLKKIVQKDTVDSDEDSLLKYFNHRKGNADNWFIIPLGSCCNNRYEGLLKLRLSKANVFKEFCLSLSGRDPYEFIVKKKAKSYVMEVSTPESISKNNLNPVFYNFKEKLRKKGMDFTDIIRETVFSDGFGGDGDYVHHGIDKVV